jgi:uncharacterized protein
MSEITFNDEVAEKLGYYVYRLVDPRNGETFYVGKGKGNRIHAHTRDASLVDDEDERSLKLTQIREIQRAGLEVISIVHRHGMEEPTALEVEAALIDAYPGLTNIVGGTGSGDYGPMHVTQIIQRYAAEEAEFTLHRVMLISINRSVEGADLYQATRLAWRVDVAKASKAEVILASVRGLIVGAFIPTEWKTATPENFPGIPVSDSDANRYGFDGYHAPPEIANRYVGKRVPDELRKKGASNPIRYTW